MNIFGTSTIIGKALVYKIITPRAKKPWMGLKEIVIISEILKELEPRKCLEWGIGYSSIFYPRYLSKDALWISIEHNPEWYAKIKPMVQRTNTRLNLVPPNHIPWIETRNDGEYADFKDYVDFPRTLNTKFDFILVDAKARKDCLICAHDILNENGIVVLHNAERGDYQDIFPLFDMRILFKADSLHADLWIGSKNLNTRNVLNIKKLEYISRTFNRMQKIKWQVYSWFKPLHLRSDVHK